jgi:hypothetical protein
MGLFQGASPLFQGALSHDELYALGNPLQFKRIP